jgi:hypothetical protein
MLRRVRNGCGTIAEIAADGDGGSRHLVESISGDGPRVK